MEGRQSERHKRVPGVRGGLGEERPGAKQEETYSLLQRQASLTGMEMKKGEALRQRRGNLVRGSSPDLRLWQCEDNLQTKLPP